MRKLLYVFAIAITLISCGKDDPDNNSSELQSGRAHLKFNMSKPLFGSTLYEVRNTEWTYAQTNILSGIRREIRVGGGSGHTTRDKHADIWFTFPVSATTSAGNIVGNFPQDGYFDVQTVDEVTHYISKSGKIIITKLTEQEMEGTFEGVVVNRWWPHDSILVTNGTFSGKF